MDRAGVIQEICYGIIPLRKQHGEWELLLIQLRAGHWSFPKGHPEAHESPKECAVRELAEETGLRIHEFLSENSLTEHYEFRRDGDLVSKNVTYFLAEVAGEVVMQSSEIKDCHWFALDAAEAQLTFPEARNLLHEAIERLKKDKG